MKVNRNYSRSRFEDIKAGTCFEYKGEFFMKVFGAPSEEYNAVYLHSGEVVSFSDKDEIVPYYNSEVTLR